MPRKAHKYHFIYKTTCTINEKFYYGMHSTSNLEDGYIGSGTKLWHSIKKYGRGNFKIEILEFLPNRETLILKEKELITEEVLLDPMCMNLRPGGDGGFISKEQQRQRSIAGGKAHGLKLKTDDSYRLRFTERVSDMMKERHKTGNFNYATFTGKKHSEETKEKMRNSHKLNNGAGEKNSQFNTCWIHNNEHVIKIKKDELENYLLLGYNKGRKLKI